jgi:hypothetical protein
VSAVYGSYTPAAAAFEVEATRSLWLSEADGGTRTPDPFITSEVLYQLSYVGRPGARRARPS